MRPTKPTPGPSPAIRRSVHAPKRCWAACEPSPAKVTHGTEAGLFHEAGIPAVVCGPGDIAQAHAADEFVALDQIAACERLIGNLISHLSN